jgi:hypothetical protein
MFVIVAAIFAGEIITLAKFAPSVMCCLAVPECGIFLL